MGWGAAIGSIGGALIASQSASDQADAMRGATQEQIDFMREKFDYARDLQERLLQEQAPGREGSRRAIRSLSMMAGLGDPGSLDRARTESQLQDLQQQLTETDKFLTTGGRTVKQYRKVPEHGPLSRATPWSTDRPTTVSSAYDLEERDAFIPESTRINPEFQRLEEEIASLEQELGGEMPGDAFEGPRDVTELPGYDFAVEQGLEGLAASGAARGMQLSGNQMEDITRFGQGTAMKFRGQLIDQLAQVAGLRPSNQPYTSLSNLATGQAQATSPLIGQMGQIGAAETAGQYGALGNALANIDWNRLGQNNQQTSIAPQYQNMAATQGGWSSGGGGGFQGVGAATPRRF